MVGEETFKPRDVTKTDIPGITAIPAHVVINRLNFDGNLGYESRR